MQFANIAKAAVLTASALWLAGCASTGGESTSSVAGTGEAIVTPVTQEEVTIEVQPVLDPAVQAVVDSGSVDASPAQIEAMLDKKLYNFPFDSSKLQEGDYKALDVQAAYLKSPEGNNKKIIIQGHTDERGTRTYNLALGERRANTVKNYLVAKGVAASRIEVISFGFEKPLNPAHIETAWSQNRRALIVTN